MTERCAVCLEGETKYQCPECFRRTCSLPCIRLHKQRWGCNGKRSRTGYTAVKDYGDRELVSDLHFLDDVKRVKETNWRNLRRVALVLRPQETPPHQRKLRYEARQRGIRLEFLPKGMSRNKSNGSWFEYRRQEICWDVDWVISLLPGKPRIHKRRIPESEIVSKALEDAVKRWPSVKVDDCAVVMKRIGCPSNAAVYRRLDLSATLRSQLEGAELVEYPVLLVLEASDLAEYNIRDKSDANVVDSSLKTAVQ